MAVMMMDSPAIHATAKSLSGQCVLFAITSTHGFSRSALYKAARLACNLGLELELFYCSVASDIDHPPLGNCHDVEDVRECVERCQSQLSAMAQDLRDTGLNVRARVEWDSQVHEGV